MSTIYTEEKKNHDDTKPQMKPCSPPTPISKYRLSRAQPRHAYIPLIPLDRVESVRPKIVRRAVECQTVTGAVGDILKDACGG